MTTKEMTFNLFADSSSAEGQGSGVGGCARACVRVFARRKEREKAEEKKNEEKETTGRPAGRETVKRKHVALDERRRREGRRHVCFADEIR